MSAVLGTVLRSWGRQCGARHGSAGL